MTKITVVVDEAGGIIAAHIPSERRPDSYTEDAVPTTNLGFLPSEDQEVLDLDLADEDVPSELGPDFLETLQRHKDGGGAVEASD